MHQTFYIDVDEEITSVISRLRKSPTRENILVIPQRAMILQSIVNLKLLKKEADTLQKQIVVVCQDRQGAIMAEKSGIFVKTSFDGMQNDEELKEEMHPQINGEVSGEFSDVSGENEVIGSDDFFEYLDKKADDSQGMDIRRSVPRQEVDKVDVRAEQKAQPMAERIVNKELVRFDDRAEPKSDGNIFPGAKGTKNISDVFPFSKMSKQKSRFDDTPSDVGLNSHKEEELNELFHRDKTFIHESSEVEKTVSKNPSNKLFKLVFVPIILLLICAGALFGYFYLPETKINLIMKSSKSEFSTEVLSDVEADKVNVFAKTIPGKLAEKDIMIELPFNATGSGTGSDQKASGKIVIYNEYGTSPQILVATTRFESEDKKIFRLAKTVTVPGMKKEGDKMVAGAIEADVIADKAGDVYNIEPTKFSIPGFEGGPKYQKFYAKSTKAMSGGGSKSSGGAVVISNEDIEAAKKKVQGEFEKKYKEEFAKELGEDYLFIDGAVDRKIVTEGPSSNAGAVAKTFDYQIKGTVKVVTMKKEDLNELIIDSLEDLLSEGYEIVISNIEYSDVKVDFEKGTLSLRAKGSAVSNPKLDIEKFKDDVKNNDNEGLRQVIAKYPQIDNMEVEYWPNFFPEKVSRFKSRIKVETSK